MKIDEIIEQCNELLDDKTYFLQTIELTKEEINILIQEIERLNNIINEYEKFLKEFSNDIEFRSYADYFLNKFLEIKEKYDRV